MMVSRKKSLAAASPFRMAEEDYGKAKSKQTEKKTKRNGAHAKGEREDGQAATEEGSNGYERNGQSARNTGDTRSIGCNENIRSCLVLSCPAGG